MIHEISKNLAHRSKESKDCGACFDCKDGEQNSFNSDVNFYPSLMNNIYRLYSKETIQYSKERSDHRGNSMLTLFEINKLCGNESLYGNSTFKNN